MVMLLMPRMATTIDRTSSIGRYSGDGPSMVATQKGPRVEKKYGRLQAHQNAYVDDVLEKIYLLSGSLSACC